MVTFFSPISVHFLLDSAFCGFGMASKNMIRAIIMGPPGSGKGTISSWIVRDFGMQHLSSGDLLRSQMAKGTGAGAAAKDAISRGELVPDGVMNELILAELSGITNVPFLLDGKLPHF